MKKLLNQSVLLSREAEISQSTEEPLRANQKSGKGFKLPKEILYLSKVGFREMTLKYKSLFVFKYK